MKKITLKIFPSSAKIPSAFSYSLFHLYFFFSFRFFFSLSTAFPAILIHEFFQKAFDKRCAILCTYIVESYMNTWLYCIYYDEAGSE